MFDLTGMTALVTGASGGIGSSIAKALAAHGAKVALSGTREEALRTVADEIGGDVVILPCNLGDAAAVDGLVPRAVEVGLARPLYYALRYTKLKLGTPVPDGVAAAAAAAAGPAGPLRVLMDALFVRALRPKHPSCSGAATRLARWLLYVRGHWLRMPMPLLLYHLTRKAVVRPDDAEPRGPKPQA